jgi:DNA-binding XRE family transcriptional regulator
MDSLSAVVGAHLETSHITKKQLAKVIGVKSTATLNYKTSGRGELSFREAHDLAKELGLSMADLYQLVSTN